MSEPEDLVRTITEEGVRDPRLLEALRAVPRAGFVPANLAGQAYEDKPLPIPHDQVTTQPSLVARMVDALGLAGSERKGAWYSPWAQAAERRWSSSRRALDGLCGAALSPWPASSGSMARTRSRSSSLSRATAGEVVTTRRERGASRVRTPGRLRVGQRRCPSRRTGVPSGPGWFPARRP